MSVDVQIPDGFDLQINQAMSREKSQHVIKKSHTGINRRISRTVEIKGQTNVRLSSFACLSGCA
jgi:hypothetical protein